MIVIPGRIPVAIHPIFWLFAALIGYLNSGTFIGTLVWVGIIFFSVLFHEFGHALTALLFKQEAKIQLIALGGVTSYEGPKMRFWQQFIVVFNGPFAGFLLFLLATFLLHTVSFSPFMQGVFKITQIANLFWTVVNLLPVIPLDGGQLLRIVLEASFGVKGFKVSLLIGAILSGLLSFYFFLIQAFLIGALFFLFAFQSFGSWRHCRHVTKEDREGKGQDLLLLAERALQEGKKEEAKRLLKGICADKKGHGMLYASAAQYLALFYAEEGKGQEAYDLLLGIKDQLAEEGRSLLHKLAAEQKNYTLIAELSAEVYQSLQTQEVALRNARAFASLKQPKPAGGWLLTAWQHGGLDLNHLLSEEPFSAIKDDPDFRHFINQVDGG